MVVKYAYEILSIREFQSTLSSVKMSIFLLVMVTMGNCNRLEFVIFLNPLRCNANGVTLLKVFSFHCNSIVEFMDRCHINLDIFAFSRHSIILQCNSYLCISFQELHAKTVFSTSLLAVHFSFV